MDHNARLSEDETSCINDLHGKTSLFSRMSEYSAFARRDREGQIKFEMYVESYELPNINCGHVQLPHTLFLLKSY